MGLALSIAAAWLTLAVSAAVLMAVLGRAATRADRDAGGYAADIFERHGPVRLAVHNERVVSDEDAAVCPECATVIVGAVDGDPCLECGTSVTELQRIRPRATPVARVLRSDHAM